MPTRKRKKAQSKKHANTSILPLFKIGFVLVLLFILGLIARSIISYESYKVLGSSTFLARGGDNDNSGSGNSESESESESSNDDNDNDSSESSDSGESTSGNSVSGSSSLNSENSSISTSVSDKTHVICTGPDGKQFETEYKDCAELNKSWGSKTNFTVLQTQTRSSSFENETEDENEDENENEQDKEQDDEIEHEEETEVHQEDDGSVEIKTKSRIGTSQEETQITISESERIKTRTKDGRTRIDITAGGIKTRYEIRDDRVIVKAEQEDGSEVELEDDTLIKIDDRLAKDDIKIATAGAEEFIIKNGTTGARTNFPLSVDLATNTLYITTTEGEKTLTVLPEQAIQNLIAANVVNRLGENAVVSDAQNETDLSLDRLVTLGNKNGVPVYEISGISDQKLLWLIPVKIEKQVSVSAETGNAVFIDVSFGDKILDAVSF